MSSNSGATASIIPATSGSSASSTAAGAAAVGSSSSSPSPLTSQDHDQQQHSHHQHHQQHQVTVTQGSAQSKMDLIEYVCTKRVKNLNYIKRIHEGRAFWLNVVKISPENVVQYYHPQTLQKRVQQWFYMGISIAPLLQLESGWQFVRACMQLMEEFEYHFSSMAVQGMKMLRALTISSTDDETSRVIKPVINKVGGNVVYEFLRTPNVPCELDYCQVVFSLCDILTFVYRKLLDETNPTAVPYESIVKLDGRFKHHFFGLISRDLNTLSLHMIKHKLTSLESFIGGKDAAAHTHSAAATQKHTAATAAINNNNNVVVAEQQQRRQQLQQQQQPYISDEEVADGSMAV